MRILQAFKKKGIAAQPELVAASIAAYQEAHRNTLRPLSSKKERAKADELDDLLKEARRHLHNAQTALSKKESETAIAEVQSARKNMEEYRGGAFIFPTMERLKEDVTAIQAKLEDLENQVTYGQI